MSLVSLLLSIIPAVVLCAFLAGCITNKNYTQTGEGARIRAAKDIEYKQSEEVVDTRIHSQLEADITGINTGTQKKKTIFGDKEK